MLKFCGTVGHRKKWLILVAIRFFRGFWNPVLRYFFVFRTIRQAAASFSGILRLLIASR